MKTKTSIHNFGKRLATFRKNKGLTQTTLAQKVGVTRRIIAYYESETKYPPTHLLIPIAKTLKISIDELLGIKSSEVTAKKTNAALWRKLKDAEKLSQKDQKTLLQILNSLLTSSNLNKE